MKREEKVIKNDIQYMRIPELTGDDEADQMSISYMPKPFRSSYEICYWQTMENNVLKICSYYFTPKVRIVLYRV